jgi:hypothetical protein
MFQKTKYEIIALLLFILITSWLYVYFINTVDEGIGSHRVTIGNYLSEYYYQYVCSILEQKDFKFKCTFEENSVYSFLRYLPDNIIFDKSIYDAFSKNGITMDYLKQSPDFFNVAFWYLNQEKQITLANIMKPQMNKIIDAALKSEGLYKKVSVPVIHFRCADTPFIRQGHYKFQKYKFFTEILRRYPECYEIILLSYTKHNTGNNEQDACAEYANSLKTHLEKNGYKVTVKSDSDVEDFATIFYSPVIISTSTSFSAMSGLFSDGDYYQTFPSTYITNNTDTRMFMYPNSYDLKHEDVPDYYDVPNVIKLLKSE